MMVMVIVVLVIVHFDCGVNGLWFQYEQMYL